MSDPTDSFYQSSNGWMSLTPSALIELDGQLVANVNSAKSALNVLQSEYDLAALQRNDTALAAISAGISTQQLEIYRALLRRHALDSQFVALAASGYKLHANSMFPFTRAPF